VRLDPITSTPMQKLRQTPILETANGDRIVVHGEAVLQITIGSFKHQAKVLVADIVDTFILGINLMDELDVKIDFKNKLLRIGNEEIAFLAEETPMGRRERIKLILDQLTAIPANSEISPTWKGRQTWVWSS